MVNGNLMTALRRILGLRGLVPGKGYKMFFFNKRRWYRRLEHKVDQLMSSFEDLQAALTAATDKVTAVKGDVETLLAKITELQSNPPTGMTAEQQASLDAAVSTAQGIASSLGSLDDLVPNPAPAEPAPEQPVAEEPAPEAPVAVDPDHPTAG